MQVRMDVMVNPEIADLAKSLALLRDHANAAQGTTENVSVSLSNRDVVIEGNTAGLLEFARVVLMVASKNLDGAHQDIDTASFASRADVAIVVALNNRLP